MAVVMILGFAVGYWTGSPLIVGLGVLFVILGSLVTEEPTESKSESNNNYYVVQDPKILIVKTRDMD